MIPLIKSTFYNETDTKQKLCRFIGSAQKLSIGEECRLFERGFARYQGRKHCVFVNSGSSANLALIQALLNLGRLQKGDRVGFSALTWSTNVMPLIQLGLEVVPVDVELDTLNVSRRTLQQACERRPIKAMFITNLLGFCDDIDQIALYCKKNNIVLVEDNCEALGTVYKMKKLGNWGTASTFSFYVGHHMSTIEGGAVCTDDGDLETMLQLVRAHGWDRNLTEQKQLIIRLKHNVNSTFYSRYTFYDLGYNLRTTEIQGFLGNNQLKYLNAIVQKRQSNFFYMAKPIYARKDLYYPVRYDHIDVVSNFAVPVICRTRNIRDELVRRCDGKVEIRPVVGGDMTSQPFFHKYVGQDDSGLTTSHARLIHEQGLYFGNNPELTKIEMDQIIKIFTQL
ncbi:DegT/DnrJ/EryC1/StrS aminotransferase family protein [Candidatus Gottesmanbacteria bacterium]|nr:DegT/DnrJ/EryC1/StrS aminotransferase family protein [Candidatus Gottesmanbacteria bacterium]